MMTETSDLDFSFNSLAILIKELSKSSSFLWRTLRLINKLFFSLSATKEELIKTHLKVEYQKDEWEYAVARSIRTSWMDEVQVDDLPSEKGVFRLAHNFAGSHTYKCSKPLKKPRSTRVFYYGLSRLRSRTYCEFTLFKEKESVVKFSSNGHSVTTYIKGERCRIGVFTNSSQEIHVHETSHYFPPECDCPFRRFFNTGSNENFWSTKFLSKGKLGENQFDIFMRFIKLIRPKYPKGITKSGFPSPLKTGADKEIKLKYDTIPLIIPLPDYIGNFTAIFRAQGGVIRLIKCAEVKATWEVEPETGKHKIVSVRVPEKTITLGRRIYKVYECDDEE